MQKKVGHTRKSFPQAANLSEAWARDEKCNSGSSCSMDNLGYIMWTKNHAKPAFSLPEVILPIGNDLAEL